MSFLTSFQHGFELRAWGSCEGQSNSEARDQKPECRSGEERDRGIERLRDRVEGSGRSEKPEARS